MNLESLIRQFREEAHDEEKPYLFSNALLTRLFNEAVDEACRRKDLLFDDSTDSVCSISVMSGTSTYTQNPSIRTISSAYLSIDQTPLVLVTQQWMDNINPLWRFLDPDTPQYLIVNQSSVRLVPDPVVNDTLKIEVFRTPLLSELMATNNSVPPISSHHHRFLYHWVMVKAFNLDDGDIFDQSKVERHSSLFNAYFGLPRDADLLQETKLNRDHRNKLW